MTLSFRVVWYAGLFINTLYADLTVYRCNKLWTWTQDTKQRPQMHSLSSLVQYIRAHTRSHSHTFR